MITASMCHGQVTEAAGRKRPAGNLKRIGLLFGCLFLVWFFIFVFAPWLEERTPSIQRLGKYIDESGISAGALYYTEVEEVGEADLAVRNTFRFYLDEQQEETPTE